MNRSFLVNLFSRVKSEHNPEAGWALDILSQRKSESLFLEEYENVGDCLCKINDHGCAQEDIIEELAGVERQLIEIINEQRKKIGYQRKALTYADLEIGMKFRIIDTSSQRYLQEGKILSLIDDLYGEEDVRVVMENGEIFGGIDPSCLDYE